LAPRVARSGARALRAEAVRGEQDQINTGLHRIAHNSLGSIAVHNLLPPEDLALFKGSTEPRQVIAGALFDALIEVPLLLQPQPWNDLNHMKQRDFPVALLGKACGDVQGLLVSV